MQESMLKRVKTFAKEKALPGRVADRTVFKTLLESMHLDDKTIGALVKPIEDAVRKEARQQYLFWCLVMLVVVLIGAAGVVCAMCGISVREDGKMLRLLIMTIVGCAVTLGILRAIYDYYDTTQLLSDKVRLLQMRFEQEGALGGLLSQMENKSNVVIYGQEAEADASERKFLGPKTAKLTVLAMALLIVVLGAGTVRCMGTNYESGSNGLTLLDWNEMSAGEVVIPAEKDGKPVTTIGKLAFENQSGITRIVVPDTVTVIESGAFRGCTNLKEVVLPDTLTTLGAEVFSGCISLQRFTLPKGVTELRADTFYNCISLSEITLHEGLTKIHANAFHGCTALTGITLPEGLTELPARAFYQCTKLKSVVIPASVKEIGAYAFEGCKSLTEVTFLSDMEGGRIGAAAFRWCVSLKKFDVPKGVTDVSAEVFYGCTALEEVTLPTVLSEKKISESLFYGCKSLKSIVIPEGVTRISAHAFQGCSSLTSVTVPASLRSIGSSAFRSCYALKVIYLPSNCSQESNSFKDSPTKIYYGSPESKYTVQNGQATLVKWGNLPPENGIVTVPAEYDGVPVTQIGDGAFKERDDVREVILPETITIIGEEAFYKCYNLKSINYPAGLTSLGKSAFMYTNISSLALPEAVTVIPDYCFYYAGFSGTLEIPGHIKVIGISAFAKNDTLKEVVFPEGIEKIESEAFSGRRLTSFKKQGSIYVGELVATLEKAVIPRTCEVHQDAFEAETEIVYYDVSGTTATTAPEPTATTAPTQTATIPPAPTATATPEPTQGPSYGVYEVRDGEAVLIYWLGDAAGVIKVEDTYEGYPVTAIDAEAFKYLFMMEEVVLPDSIRTIGSQAFFGCFGLETVNMPSQLEEIGEGAFEYCDSLKSVTLPDGLQTIGARAFKATGLKEVTIPESVQSIGAYAFSECSSLRQLTLYWGCEMHSDALNKTPTRVEYLGKPEKTAAPVAAWPTDGVYSVADGEATLTSWGENIQGVLTVPAEYNGVPVTKIATNAFKNRGEITCVVLPDSVREIGNYAFSGCENLKEITLPAGLEKIGVRAFENCTSLERIVLPEGVKTVGAYAFYGCKKLESVILPDSLESISQYVFSRCESLLTIEIPKDCKTHGNTFSGCPQLVVEYK